MATILSTERDMDANASDTVIWGLVHRLERDGHHLTPKAVLRIHQIITDCTPDNRMENGSQTEAARAIRERIERDDK